MTAKIGSEGFQKSTRSEGLESTIALTNQLLQATSKPHFSTGSRRKTSDAKVVESRPGRCATALPTPDHKITFGYEISNAPEIEVRKRFAETGHERLDLCMTATGRVQRILHEHVGRRELLHNFDVVKVAPEFREPGGPMSWSR